MLSRKEYSFDSAWQSIPLDESVSWFPGLVMLLNDWIFLWGVPYIDEGLMRNYWVKL